jgi:hypothetical protein
VRDSFSVLGQCHFSPGLDYLISVTEASCRSFVKDLSLAIRDLAELAEPIQTYVDLHRGHGPLSRLKNAIFEREETRHGNGKARQDTQKYIYGSAYFDVIPKFPQHQQVNTSTVDRSDSQRDTVV